MTHERESTPTQTAVASRFAPSSTRNLSSPTQVSDMNSHSRRTRLTGLAHVFLSRSGFPDVSHIFATSSSCLLQPCCIAGARTVQVIHEVLRLCVNKHYTKPAHIPHFRAREFFSLSQDLIHQVSSECLCLDKTTILTSGTPCLARSRCCSLT